MLPSGARSHSYDHGMYEGAAFSISSLSLSSVRERSTRRRSGGGLLDGVITHSAQEWQRRRSFAVRRANPQVEGSSLKLRGIPTDNFGRSLLATAWELEGVPHMFPDRFFKRNRLVRGPEASNCRLKPPELKC